MAIRSKTKKNKVLESKEAEKFVSQANYSEKNDECEKEYESHPWKNPNLDASKERKLTVRIPEEYALKLNFVTKNRTIKTSKQRYILETIIPLIDKELKKMGAL